MEQSMTRIAAGQRMDALAERDWDANDPAGFRKLETEQRNALVDWIRAVLVPAKSIFRRNSYGMKHDFAREPDGFYVKNGAFKGAMLTAGFRPVDRARVELALPGEARLRTLPLGAGPAARVWTRLVGSEPLA